MQPLAARAQKEKALSKKLVGITQVDTKKKTWGSMRSLVNLSPFLLVCLLANSAWLRWRLLACAFKLFLQGYLVDYLDPILLMWSHVIPCDPMWSHVTVCQQEEVERRIESECGLNLEECVVKALGYLRLKHTPDLQTLRLQAQHCILAIQFCDPQLAPKSTTTFEAVSNC